MIVLKICIESKIAGENLFFRRHSCGQLFEYYQNNIWKACVELEIASVVEINFSEAFLWSVIWILSKWYLKSLCRIRDCRCCGNLFLEGILVVISVRSAGSRKKTSTRKFVLHTTTSSYKNKVNIKQKGLKYVKYCFFIELRLRVKYF